MTDRPPSEHDDQPAADHAALAERAVIGAMLLSPAAIDEANDVLTGRDYASPRNELIHDTITTLHAAGTPVDGLTVADTLGPDLPRAGGLSYILDCATHAPIPAAVTRYADIVRAAAHLRTVDAAVTRIHQAITTRDREYDVLELVNTARDELDRIATADTRAMPHPEAVYAALDELEQPPGMPTPWDRLTSAIAGWKPACLYIVGARPGIGKSVAGAGIALDVARRGKTALVYSLEMSRAELYHRLIASVGSIDMSLIQHRKLTPTHWEHLAPAAKHIAELPIHIDDRAALSLTQIRAHVKAEQRKHDVGIVVVDYLQLIAPPTGAPRDDRRVQVDAISRGLKNLAKDTCLPVVALAQLNRGLESRADKTPTLTDLREAGGQEQDADVVLLLHRDLSGSHAPATELKVVVGKNRHGSTTSFDLFFRGEYSRIEDPPWSPSATLERNDS
ncbi:MAG TPA: DnaB-like helicase C-terminal domain-containing protein [Intrasporangium sp.]|uniref:replicative DNA helicase n=1 Tax=Intrasporangium sp. TaxID=1925024 RepID=UPI002D7682CF|nr:DnaB-like helicase C-terminal domain-containing protein [Intrasporangium sp.]HET7398972.1 DnaB-like helicase C-terminal domain-containing protein [Intrasporangium sp.]